MTQNQTHESHVKRQITILLVMMLGISTLTAIASVAASWISIERTLTSTVLIHQDETSVISWPAMACPGASLPITYHVQSTKVPSIINIYDNWRSVDLGYNIILEDHPVFSIISTQENFTRTIVVEVPNVQPGNYEYVRAAQEDGSPISIMTVPLKIVTCP